MKWMKRGCWIGAWGVWVWCGFGLARELPRPNGPTLAKLKLEDGEWIDRLVVGTSLAVSRSVAPDGERSRRVWDLRTGEISKERLDAKEAEVDRNFLVQRGPRNEREDQVESSTRSLERNRSADGRFVLDLADNRIIELSSGRVVDAGCAERTVFGFGGLCYAVTRSFEGFSSADVYVCDEAWFWKIGPARGIKETSAVHTLKDGRLLYRLHRSPDLVTTDCSLSLHGDGEINAIPPPPNLMLLALCQTILALPIILLWAVLRWRRRRKAIAQ